MKTEHPDFERIYAHVVSAENDGQAYKLLGRRGAAESGPAPAMLPAE